MKNLLIWVLLSLATRSAQGQDEGIRFVAGTWNEVQTQAKKLGKPIFVFGTSEHCSPCHEMEKTTLREAAAGAYFNDKFVSYRLDLEKGEGIGFAKQHDIVGFPTYLFFAADGTLLHRSSSGKPAAALVTDGETAFNPALAFYGLQRRYQAGERSAAFLYLYATASAAAGATMKTSPAEEVVAAYMKTQSTGQLRTEKNLRLLYKHSSPQVDLFFLQNQAAFGPFYTPTEIRQKADGIISSLAFEAGVAKNAVAFQQVKQLIAGNFADTARATSLATIQFMEGGHDWIPYTQATLRYSQYPNPDLYTLTKTVKYVKYMGNELGPVRQQEALRLALQLMPVILKQKKDYYNTLLHAEILHQLHQEANALAVAREAISLAQSKQEPTDEANKLVASIQAAQKE
ncbi:thioredoxin family protein [Hymenobacter tibetensis]|uniref:Thioredoxin family protein n=1 Tax=Hymenobacter tibetensis TaxID=497967 RepID=A0ABY4D1G3_9BACT|nr:thioredoxin family protein [Hymenobacter tibetensis]UOG75897.1 thioredoxin family protein [Hymenobacter tibetensis]